MPKAVNLHTDLPESQVKEQFETLAASQTVRIERIISHGQSSPPGFWYDQDHEEWVLLLQGGASIRFEGDPEPVALRPGDCVNIPTHAKHRVEWTDPDRPTVWLAVHY